MLLIAKAALQGWWQGLVLASALFQVPILHWLSLSVLSLLILRKGVLYGVLALILMLGVHAVLSLVVPYFFFPMVSTIAAFSVLCSAAIWRWTVRAEWAWCVAVMVTIVIVLGLERFHYEALKPYVEQWMEVMHAWLSSLPEASREELAPILTQEALYENGVQFVALFATFLVGPALFLSRWWQSRLFNPGGFGEEFRAYRLEASVSIGLLLLWSVVQLLPGAAGAVAQLLWVPFLIGGIALVHWFLREQKASSAWLALFYSTLFITRPVVIGLAIAESFFGLRRLWMRKRYPPSSVD